MSTNFARQQFLTYENFTMGIRMKYPADWWKQDQFPGPMVMFASPPESPSDYFRENLSVTIEPLPPGTTLEQYVNQGKTQAQATLPNFNVIESKSGMLSGFPASDIVFGFNPGPFPLKWRSVCTVTNDKAYALVYRAEAGKYDKFLAAAQAMIDSFEIA
jgi:eukaryotic-like serine/threonine-protein kinase